MHNSLVLPSAAATSSHLGLTETALLKGTGAQRCPSIEGTKTANILYGWTDGQNVVIAAARVATS